MTEQWTCPQCNHANAADMRFCPHCGATNPALATPPAGSSGTEPTPTQGNRRLLWTVAIGLWLVGCVVIAVGGGMWWARQGGTEVTALTTPPTASSVTVPSPAAATATPTLTPSPEPTTTATPTPVEMDTSESAAGDDLSQDSTGDSLASTGDTLAPPTSISEGVILFLSSRDHDPQTEAGPSGPAQNRSMELYAMKPDGSQQTRLSDGNRDWWNGDAALTPYHIPNQVVVNGKYVFDLTARQVVEELKLEFANPNAPAPLRADFPMWSSRGEIIFGWPSPGIYYLQGIQDKPQPLTDPPENVWGDGFPAWSPDGEWIVFMRNWQDQAQDGLWLMKPDGSEAHRIIAGSANVPRRAFWSPDSRRLAYEGPKSNTERFMFEVWVMQVDGSNPQQLTSFPENTGAWEPKWSPDGQHLVFWAGDSFAGQISVIDAESGEPQQLTTIGDQNIAPLWLPLSSDDLLNPSTDSIVAIPSPTPQPPTPTPKSIIAVPTPVAPPNCPNPGVQITSPQPGAVFTDRDNYIIGTANINRFHHWRLEYSTNPGGSWNYLFERDYPVDNDKLMMLDASTVPVGPYGLRLTVVDETGNYPEPCEVWYTNSY